MATWTGYETTPLVLAQSEKWKSECLAGTGSMFSNETLWTAENFEELKTLFVDNPILGDKTFYEKLTLQLEGARPEVSKVAAEALWLLLLFVGDSYYGTDTKIQRIGEVWALSGAEFPNRETLDPGALAGVANPGIAFLTRIWAEYGFLLEVVQAWKTLPPDRRDELLDDRPWELCEWLTEQNGGNARAFRHMFLYFCYPPNFERCCSKNHKKKIYDAFRDKLSAANDPYQSNPTLCNLDKAIFSVRNVLEQEYGTSEIDFYDDTLRPQWDEVAPKGKKEVKKSRLGPKVWIEKSIVNGRTDRQEGEHRLGAALWSPQRSKTGRDIYASMRKVAPGDIVLHLTDNSAITGVSRIAAPVDDTFTGVTGTVWGEQPGYRVPLEDFEVLEPELPRNAFFGSDSIGNQMRALLDSEDGKGLFYNRKLELNQGSYLTEMPAPLVTLINRAYQGITGRKLIEWEDVEVEVKPTNFPNKQALNTIFYGPPGTGKTFVTARRSVEICDGSAPVDHNELRARYTELVKQKRVEFITFHQTYGYEEFVEGLRPETGSSEDEETGAGFRLQPIDGVLKRIADRARKLPASSNEAFDPSNRQVFKVSLGRSNVAEDDYLREDCLANDHVLLGHGGEIDWSDNHFDSYHAIAERWRQEPGEGGAHSNSPNILFPFQLRVAMREGDLVLASRGNRKLQAVGVVDGPYQYVRREADDYHHMRPVKWLWKDETGDGIPVGDVLDRNFSQQSIYGITTKAVNWDALLPYLQTKVEAGPPPPHVLIIDEINRANISKVMGEIITLLEEDKREGALNETVVTLPHSGKAFTLPSNLHIVGTMNTADRSIALLDTALRRRFQFEEIAPEPGLLSKIDDVDLSAVLTALNSRLEWFLGPDHLIGHAWLMNAQNLEEIDTVMAKKIIPMLREYFHEDLGRVRAILGGGNRFLRRTKIDTPPGLDDDYGEERWRYIDRYRELGGYGADAYDEIINGVEEHAA